MELQKYYTGSHMDAMYLASEADAAFAEMRREHAEEIERLKDEMHSMEADHFQHIGEAAAEYTSNLNELRKQAERYEKLRSFELAEYYYPSAEAFDFYVDQLPASGEKP